jgi:hypothetical protein
LWNISDKYLYKLDDNILKNYKHANKLYACNNDITNIYHVIKLEDLNVSILCWISNEGIISLNDLEVLNASHYL